jgi:hypothetical protein
MAQKEIPDAITLLTNDHREVEQLFEKYEKAASGSKQKIAQQICDELKIHSMIEEEIFYPACEGIVDEDDIKEAYVEHDSAKVLINDILSEERKEDEFYDAKVKVLKEDIEHHIKEEENGKDSIFGQVKGKKDIDLNALGEQMFERKTELKKMAKDGTLPPASTTAVTPMPL